MACELAISNVSYATAPVSAEQFAVNAASHGTAEEGDDWVLNNGGAPVPGDRLASAPPHIKVRKQKQFSAVF